MTSISFRLVEIAPEKARRMLEGEAGRGKGAKAQRSWS